MLAMTGRVGCNDEACAARRQLLANNVIRAPRHPCLADYVTGAMSGKELDENSSMPGRENVEESAPRAASMAEHRRDESVVPPSRFSEAKALSRGFARVCESSREAQAAKTLCHDVSAKRRRDVRVLSGRLARPALRRTIDSSVSQSVGPYNRPSIRPSVVRTSVRPSVHLFVPLFVRPSARLSVRPSVRPSLPPSVLPQVHSSIRPSVSRSFNFFSSFCFNNINLENIKLTYQLVQDCIQTFLISVHEVRNY